MSAKDTWTPYGLEAIRVRHLRRRRFLLLFIALGLAGLWALMFETTTDTTQEIFVNGQRANTIDITVPDQPPQRDGPVTVAVAPGRVTRAESGSGAQGEQQTPRASAPIFERAPAIPYAGYLIVYGPFGLLAAALLLLGKRRGKHDQVNYGIYKGALPFELVSASMADQVFTSRMAKRSLFGKRRADHLTPELLRVERVPQEAEEA
jgi:hypothetical protein